MKAECSRALWLLSSGGSSLWGFNGDAWKSKASFYKNSSATWQYCAYAGRNCLIPEIVDRQAIFSKDIFFSCKFPLGLYSLRVKCCKVHLVGRCGCVLKFCEMLLREVQWPAETSNRWSSERNGTFPLLSVGSWSGQQWRDIPLVPAFPSPRRTPLLQHHLDSCVCHMWEAQYGQSQN